MNTFPDQYFEVAILWTKFKKKTDLYAGFSFYQNNYL